MSPTKPKTRWRRSLLIGMWLAVSVLGVRLLIQPVASIRIHVLELFAAAIFILGTLALVWRKWTIRLAMFALLAFATASLLLPGREHDHAALRMANARALRSYDGVEYVWGGEGGCGVDCSGLIRRGLMDACLREGARTLNPKLLRASLTLWWHDCSANALGEGYREWTRPVIEAASINALDHSRIENGDLGITAGGAHILAFLGGREWMQAAPEVGHAARFDVPSTNGWFYGPVKIVRWRLLE